MFKKTGYHMVRLLSAPKNLAWRALGIPLLPKGIVFMITDRCNSRCAHCSIWQQKPADDPLTPQEIEKVFSDRLFRNVRYVICTGGEPSVRDDLGEILLSLHRALPQATLQLSTNGLLAQRVLSVVRSALENGINLEVGVSLDGIGDTHDTIRGVPGNFQKSDLLLHQLAEMRTQYPGRLKVAAGIVVSDLTKDSIYPVREYARGLNIELVEAWYNISSFYHNASQTGKLNLKEEITRVVETQPPSLMRQRWLAWLKTGTLRFPCFAAQTFCVVKCNGDMVPCLNLWEDAFGNVRDRNPSEIWGGAQARQKRKKIKRCSGCLNSWGAGWSFEEQYFPVLWFYLKNPGLVFNLRKKQVSPCE